MVVKEELLSSSVHICDVKMWTASSCNANLLWGFFGQSVDCSYFFSVRRSGFPCWSSYMVFVSFHISYMYQNSMRQDSNYFSTIICCMYINDSTLLCIFSPFHFYIFKHMNFKPCLAYFPWCDPSKCAMASYFMLK